MYRALMFVTYLYWTFFIDIQNCRMLKAAFCRKGFRGKVGEKSEKVAILKHLSRKSYLYCLIGLQMTEFKKMWHNFMKKLAFLACFSSIFSLNKEEKWRKNRKTRTFWEKATFTDSRTHGSQLMHNCSESSTVIE